MVEIVIDIADRIIAINNAGPVESSANAIDKLVDLKVLQSSEPYIDMIRFRNFIVHQYESVDPAILHNIVTTKLNSFREFAKEISMA